MVAKVVGELPRSFDPAVSEWENSPLYEGTCFQVIRFIEFIKDKKGTRGTETSKYPEEYKSNEISLVAASENEKV